MIWEEIFSRGHYWLPLVGFLIGMLATMVGGGGAFFFPPVLILVFHIPPQVAAATSLAAAIPVGLVGTWSHYRSGNVNTGIGLAFGLAGLAGAAGGAILAGLLVAKSLKTAFGIYSILLGLGMLAIQKERPTTIASKPLTYQEVPLRKKLFISIFGFFSGGFAGLFGTSGTAPALAGLFILKLPLKIVIGTSVMVVFFNAVSGLGSHLVVGQVDLVLTLLLGSGAAAGAFTGPRLLKLVNPGKAEGAVRLAFSVLILVTGILMLTG
jgi:uncharacterized protein